MAVKTCIALFVLGIASLGCSEPRPVGAEQTTPSDLAPPPEPPPPAAEPEPPLAAEAPAPPKPIEVTVNPASGSKVQGTGQLEEVAEGVKLTLKLTAVPAGKHGIHIHQTADCSDPEAKSAGDHFAPDHNKHGFPDQAEHHLGDMGNLTAEKDGNVNFEFVLKGANLKEGDPKSLVGRAIILHAKEDKGTQPSGDAGGRIACSAIKR
ncbi:superoxide dismutase family protein [Chondromyces crocatus]|uniref:superoxide dismutase family protein n=1 Tax=Chondromyces crocatus TaxID=52 RepID=UPI0012E1E775|nr:superoxide dismutase family protein [Chondromyces crocatus]